MAWSGGTFSRLYNWVTDKGNSVPITASRMDAEMDGMATGITACIHKGGQNAASADLPMGGNKHTNVGEGSARNHYPAISQIQDGGLVYAADSGTANTYTVTLSPAITAYTTGQPVIFKASNTNTGTSTLNVNGVGAKIMRTTSGETLTAGDIQSGGIYLAIYDGTYFQIVGLVPAGEGEESVAADGDVIALKADLIALDTSGFSDGESRYVKESSGNLANGSLFIWRTGDKSTEVADDPANWWAPSGEDGSSGAWQRSHYNDNRTVQNKSDLVGFDISALEDNDAYYVIETTLDDADGFWAIWQAGDQSANVTNDPDYWFATTGDDGTNGAWQITEDRDGLYIYQSDDALTGSDSSKLSDGDVVYMSETATNAVDGTFFIWRSGDNSSSVSADPHNWFAPDGETGSLGAWEAVRPIPRFPQITTEATTGNTLSLVHLHVWLECTNSNGCEITVPPESSVAWPDGAEIHGASTQDTCTFVEGSGVTILVPSGFELETVTDSAWTLKKVGTNTWRLIGYLVETA